VSLVEIQLMKMMTFSGKGAICEAKGEVEDGRASVVGCWGVGKSWIRTAKRER